MGNGVRFLQARDDFPVMVRLDRNAPVWELERWGAEALRFRPLEEEGFRLRGDGRRVLYRGRNKSHRFTILGNDRFEYDCILNREPESNVIALAMEGAERFDFFRQPDFGDDPFLKGSYAVYKKETLAGEGTGKLCHIHRPRIIDALGRRVWGDLAVAGNRLLITIPEGWLAGAKYPVVVDPTVGTTTVGSYTTWYDPDEGASRPLYLETAVGVNRFLIPQAFNGQAAAYVYAYSNDYETPVKPVLYSDNGNVPNARRSASEGSFDVAVSGSKPAGWRSAAFSTNTNIAAGTYIWFGLFCVFFRVRFDYGAKCFMDYWDGYSDIPNTYPLYHVSSYYDFKISMYFDYSSAQHYVRTITQGVTLHENIRRTGSYIRNAQMTAGGTTALQKAGVFHREVETEGAVFGAAGRFLTMPRGIGDIAGNISATGKILSVFRFLSGGAGITGEAQRAAGFNRDIADSVQAHTVTGRIRGFIRMLAASVAAFESAGYFRSLLAIIADCVRANGEAGHIGDYLRGLWETAGIETETGIAGEYCRGVGDVVRGVSSLGRALSVFIKLVSGMFIHDFLVRRFLVSREEVKLKSAVVREVVVESRIGEWGVGSRE
jgi:hypothetical protein